MRTTYRVARWSAVAFFTALTLAACTSGGSSGSSAGPGGASAGPGATSPEASATNHGAAIGFATSAEEYTKQAVAAWSSGDTARLDQLRDPGAAVFGTLSAGDIDRHFTLYQCQGAAGSTYCTYYNNAGDELRLQLSNPLLGQAHAIVGGDFHPITFPSDERAYAQETLDAWLAHNDPRITLLCTGDAATHLNAIPGSHRSDAWTFDHSEGAAGSFYLSWKNPAGDAIVFRFRDPGIPPTPGPQHRVVDVIFQPHA
jgi:hypothetical protein